MNADELVSSIATEAIYEGWATTVILRPVVAEEHIWSLYARCIDEPNDSYLISTATVSERI